MSKKRRMPGNKNLVKRKFTPLTTNQSKYVESINKNDITICIGKAGTGKSFCSAGIAIEHLVSGKVDKILISRPALECGEKLGHLPGEFEEKIYPYMTPILESMAEFVTKDEMDYYLEEGIIELCPVAFMRGRSFKRCFVLLDEAQNCTLTQLKMVLSRIGEGSKLVINGDTEQSDLGKEFKRINPLMFCVDKLSNIDGVGIVRLLGEDIVRHRLIDIILTRLAEK